MDLKRAKKSDQLEAEIRASYYPNKLAELLGTVMAIEHNAAWCATKVGKQLTMDENTYTEEDLAKVLERQEETRQDYLKKIAFIKKQIDAK